MASDTAKKEWDRKYSSGEAIPDRNPSRLLVEFLPQLPRGKALDIACGEGRNAIYLVKNGYEVDAVDISEIAVNKGRTAAGDLKATFIQADLTEFRIPKDRYDVIMNFNYLERSLVNPIMDGLRTGGYLIFETYTLEQREFGPPRNPDFLLGPNELLNMFRDLHIIYYREGIVEADGKKAIASLVGKKI